MFTALLPAVASQAAQPKTVAEAQAQLDQLDQQAETAAEAFNNSKALLTQAQQRAAATALVATRAHDAMTTEQATVGKFAAASYMSGGASAGLAVVLSTKDPAQTMQRVATLQNLSSQQSAALSAVRSADLRYQQTLKSAAQATAAATKAAQQVAQQQAKINAAIAKSEQVLAQLTAAQRAQLLAAQNAKRAADRARAAAAVAAFNRAQSARAASRSIARPAVARGPRTDVAPAPAVPQSAGGSSVAERAVAAAMSKLGSRYVYGAGGPNTFDCSGLVQWAYGQAGISTAHYTGAFWAAYRHVPSTDLQPGDLVFFYADKHHVGIYLGGGMMVNAPHTGDVVRVAPVFGGGRQYVGAVRVVG